MNLESVNETGLSFSLSELPADYPYRYSINYILMRRMSEPQRVEVIKELVKQLNFTPRMLQNYRYVGREETRLQLSDERLDIIAAVLEIPKGLLIASPVKSAE